MDILDSIDQVKNLNKGKNKLHFDEIITKLKKDENINLESEKKKITNKFINKRKKIINNKLNEDENSYYDSKNEIYFLNKKSSIKIIECNLINYIILKIIIN